MQDRDSKFDEGAQRGCCVGGMSLFADHNLPFAVALGVMVLLAVLQAIGLGDMLGEGDVDFDADADAEFDGGQEGVTAGLLSFLGIGRVPFMVWLATFLLVFAAVGVSLQGLAETLTGETLFPWLAAVLAGTVGLPIAGLLVHPLARILPHDETTAVGLDSLVGRRATVTTGEARGGFPARARVLDHHGHPHHVMVEPQDAEAEIREGEPILLVRRDDQLFYAVALQERRLAPE